MQHRAQKICLFGGTFDPIHLGHTYIASKCRRELNIDKIIFLPCRQSPHKPSQRNTADHHRLAMCKLATEHLPWVVVDDYDLEAPAPSYSWRTAELFQKRYPEAQLYWLMGADQWEVIDQWTRPGYLASMVQFIVISRNGAIHHKNDFQYIHLHGNHAASATHIRNNWGSISAKRQLHPLVCSYAQTHQLYHSG